MKPTLPFLLIAIFLISACTSVTLPVAGRPTAAPFPSIDPGVAAASTATSTPAAASSPTNTELPSATLPSTDTLTPLDPALLVTPALPGTPAAQAAALSIVHQGPGVVICPILLYHHIEIPKLADPYYVKPGDFRAQMQALKDWGYTSITATQLVQAINFGADLPARPIVITFDDGDESVYTTAFPIMQALGFIGVNYVIASFVGQPTYLTVPELKEMDKAGWELGSHSMTHPDLTHSDKIEWEMVESKTTLKNLLRVPINTFAYPYGKADINMYDVLMKHYQAGMGLGVYTTQRTRDLWYLWRRPVELGATLAMFASYLPWNTPPS